MVDSILDESVKCLEKSGANSPRAVQQLDHNVVQYGAEAGEMSAALKAYLFEHMYYSFRIVRMKKRAERFIMQIFETLIEEPRQMPEPYQAMLSRLPLHRVVADYIASMTDRSALLEYRHLYDPLMRP
jgi:dGTPase